MEVVEYILTYITPYIAVVVLVGGIAYQAYRWRQRSPVPAHLSLYPRPESRLGRLGDALLDMFTMKGLFKVNKLLWVGGFVMHVGLLLLILGHIRVVTDFYFLWDWINWGESETHTFSAVAGTTARKDQGPLDTGRLFRAGAAGRDRADGHAHAPGPGR